MAAIQETIKCTQCHKKFYANGFGVSRLGIRFKTCLECTARRNAYTIDNDDFDTWFAKNYREQKGEFIQVRLLYEDFKNYYFTDLTKIQKTCTK